MRRRQRAGFEGNPSAPRHPDSYDYYFASGYYDSRYPHPNRHVLETLAPFLPAGGGHVIDFGCGTGRYAFWLAGRGAVVGAFDVSSEALRCIAGRRRNAPGRERLHILGPSPSDLELHVGVRGRADLVLAIFGVIAHIEGAQARREQLHRLAALAKPETGRVIVSVPNRRRRFRAEQRRAERSADGILYGRRHDGQDMEFFYKLYDVAELRRELTAAGLRIERLLPESTFPEAWIANSGALNRIDQALSRALPCRAGYGLMAVCRPEPGRAAGAAP